MIRRIHSLRYRVEQVYSVVYHIGRYKEFLPWCIDSVVTKETENVLHAKLEVGFPPLKESYTSVVTVKPNKSIHVSNQYCSTSFKALTTCFVLRKEIDI